MEEFKIGEFLGKSSRLLSNRLQKEFIDHHLDLTPEQWMILEILIKGSHSQKELCEITLKSKASINSLISNLIKLGLIDKEFLAKDKRNTVISITEKGKDVKEKSNKLASKTLRHALNGFDEDEINTLKNLLSRVKENLIK